MDNRYIPTSDEVRGAWIALTHAPESFDRWLAQVKAKAWEEGWAAELQDRNPYRQGEPV